MEKKACYTIADISEMTKKEVIDVRVENKYVVVTLETGLRIKIPNWKADE